MSNPALIEACKRLKLGSGIVQRAAKIKSENHTDFLLELFTDELEERDRKRRNAYIKAAGFSIPKTFEKYTFEDIKFPKALTADDITQVTFVRECLALRVNGIILQYIVNTKHVA